MRPIVSTNTILLVVFCFIFGLAVGLTMAWQVWPVQWINASPAFLRDDLKAQYAQMVADSLQVNTDLGKAQLRLNEFGSPDAAKAAIQLATSAASDDGERLRLAQLQPLTAFVPVQQTGGGILGAILNVLPLCGVVVLFLVLGGGGAFFMSSRGSLPAPKTSRATPGGFTPAPGSTAQIVQPEIAYAPGEEPISTFKTTYMLGNDLYDESFSVDDQQGDFLGECGVGIGETIGVGDPKKVTAFEVWLFDKNDIRTVTKVVMSDHAFRDEALKNKLASKGEPVMARSGEVVRMETATLKVEARIVDLQYGSGPLPPNSFFQQLTLEISAWKKAA
ncbi:MAG: hypothetical protein HYZ49_00335 [Chloroflexi bacterium]|nr:hypothetical protein [Chloroflexota bacterium]